MVRAKRVIEIGTIYRSCIINREKSLFYSKQKQKHVFKVGTSAAALYTYVYNRAKNSRINAFFNKTH